MGKDAYYFSHDSNAKDDQKCMLLIDQLGLEGYGIYWILIETLRDQPEYKYPVELVPILAKRYGTSAAKMLLVVEKFNFFVFDEDRNFFSLSLIKRMIPMENKREQSRLAGIKSGIARRKIALNAGSTDVQPIMNQNEQSKVKESKVKESKGEESKGEEINLSDFAKPLISFDDLIKIWNEESKQNQNSLLLESKFARSANGEPSKFSLLVKFLMDNDGDLPNNLKKYFNNAGKSWEYNFAYAMNPTKFVDIWDYKKSEPKSTMQEAFEYAEELKANCDN